MCNLRHDVQPLGYLAKACVVAVEVRGRLAAVYDEELRSARVASGMRHRQHAEIVVLVITIEFAVDAVPRAAVADAVRAAALCNESRNDPVEFQAVIEPFFCEFDKIRDRLRRVVFKEFHGHGAAVGGDFSVHVNQLL